MTIGLSHRRAPLLLSLALALIMAILALTTVAQARRSACLSAAHVKHGAHSCAATKHGHKAQLRRASRAHRRGRGALSPRTLTRAASLGSGATVPATCEDGTDATSTKQGSLSCTDGSEATCDDGSSPRHLSGSPTPVCPAAPEPEAEPEATCEDASGNPCAGGPEEPQFVTQPACADGSAPAPAAAGFASCNQSTGPSCGEGSSATFSSDGSSFVCEKEE